MSEKTLRDEMAMVAMKMFYAESNKIERRYFNVGDDEKEDMKNGMSVLAENSYFMADAMLAVRKATAQKNKNALISNAPFPRFIIEKLRRAGYEEVDQLTNLTDREVRLLPGIGRGTTERIKECLATMGLGLRATEWWK